MGWLRFLLGTVTVTVPATVTFIDVVGYVAKVEGASMQPSLNPELENGKRVVDYVFLNRWEARLLNFQRGEVVSLVSPSNPDQKIIKRIIGLEGDTVRAQNNSGREVRVPSGHCWVEGDHHGQSMDSNFFGPISMGLIQAKASAIVWPPGRWQRLPVLHPNSSRLSPAPPRGS